MRKGIIITYDLLILIDTMAKGWYRPGAGRKKGFKAIEAEKAREYIASRVSKELEPIIDKAIEQAKAGDQTARRDLFDRAYGRPRETVEVQSEMILKLDI